jgi:hypothetical protein
LSSESKEENYWPHFILASILAVAGLCVWTVKIAINNPVEMDSFYFEKYQQVDENINEIILKQQEFDKKYDVVVRKDDFKIGENEFFLNVHTKDNKFISDAKVEVTITRPDTSKYDKKLEVSSVKEGTYIFKPFNVEKIGRWQIMSKITVNNLTSFMKNEVNATK